MKKVHERNGDTWYEHGGVFFRVSAYSKLSEATIKTKIENPDLPRYSTKTFEEYSLCPLLVFRVGAHEMGVQNMSLYEYLVLLKGKIEDNPLLKSVCMQTEYVPLVFAVEPYDDESELGYESAVVQKNVGIIENAIRQHAKELMAVVGKTEYCTDWYV